MDIIDIIWISLARGLDGPKAAPSPSMSKHLWTPNDEEKRPADIEQHPFEVSNNIRYIRTLTHGRLLMISDPSTKTLHERDFKFTALSS